MYWYDNIISKIDKEIAEYLEKRYLDYSKDRNEEKACIYGREEVMKRHQEKQQQLIEFGFLLVEKLDFFLPKSRKELFEQINRKYKSLDIYTNNVNNDFCNELDKVNDALPLYKRKESYTLNSEKSDKRKRLFDLKEMMKDNLFIEKIDKRRADYERRKAEIEKKEAEERAETKAIEVALEKSIMLEERSIMLEERRRGYTNIKPICFYDEDFMSDYEIDVSFQEGDIPEEDNIDLIDTPEGNQKYLDRLKEILNLNVLVKTYSYQEYFNMLEEYQGYLMLGYLFTNEIAWKAYALNDSLIDELSRDPNVRYKYIRDHPARGYKIAFYSDNFDIEKIKEEVDMFIEYNKALELTPIVELEKYLEKHDNEVSIVDYARFKGITYKVSKRILKGFETKKKLKSKNVGSE
ncbi:hypothetical protein LCGC14_2767890, partial [marine sediment metagenome]